MGTWGAGNFDNDGALDFMNDVSYNLIQSIEACLADESCSALDEKGESVIMPSVVILSLLYERCCATAPELEVVQRWKQTYLAVYDESIDGFEPKADYKIERRAVIAATFDKMEAQVQEQEAQYAANEPYMFTGPTAVLGPFGLFQANPNTFQIRVHEEAEPPSFG